MKYALNLSEDNRILSACIVLPNGNYEGMPIVEELPDGNLHDYRHIEGGYIYDPLPKPPEPEPEPPISEQLAALRQENHLLKEQVKSVSDRGDFIEDCIAEMAMQVYA